MSHSRKKLKNTVLTDFPTIQAEDESVVKVTELRGNNIEVEKPDQTKLLVQIPTRFRKLIWIKRGAFLIVREPAALANLDNFKIKATVQHVLFPQQISHLIKINQWPKEFSDLENEDGKQISSSQSSSSEQESSTTTTNNNNNNTNSPNSLKSSTQELSQPTKKSKSKNGSAAMIDDDMLPPSDSDEENGDYFLTANPNRIVETDEED